MSEPISKGDLVLLVGPLPCCGIAADIGRVFVAASGERRTSGQCALCSRVTDDALVVDHPLGGFYPRSVLKRIPPLSEPETIDTTDEVTA